MTRLDYFMQRIERVTESGCWLWTGGIRRAHGRTADRPLLSMGAHHPPVFAYRFAYEFFVGAIPAGLHVCHRCDVTVCVNPAHLFVGTNTENRHDMIRKGRARYPRGERMGAAKLTDALVREIRSTYVPGDRGRNSACAIAKRLGVNPSTVYLAATGKTWRHL